MPKLNLPPDVGFGAYRRAVSRRQQQNLLTRCRPRRAAPRRTADTLLTHHPFAVGMQYSQGTYIRAYYYQNYFGNSTYFEISWVGAVNSVAFPMLAPFVGSLVGYLGPQITAVTGAVTQCLGFILASFATQAWQMILTQGFIFGIGEVLIYFAGIASIQQHFLKKRGLAVGLTMSGSGFGGLVVSLLCQALIDKVGFAWSLRIIGFLLLGVGASCGLLMKSLVPPGFRTRKKGAKRGKALDFGVFRVEYFKAYYVSNAIGMVGTASERSERTS